MTLSNVLINDDETFARLLDDFHTAVQAGTQSNYWELHSCSVELRQRIENAYQGLEAFHRYVEATPQQKSSPFASNESMLGPFFAQPMSLNRFQIEREVGRGGFGIVYLAEDTALKRPVAIKVPRVEAWATEDARQRFLKEAEIAAGLDHPHIVPVFEVGQSGQAIYIVSLYCPGRNLGQWLLEHPNQLEHNQVVELMSCMASAMAYCHERNVLHRDLKPANVLLFPTEQGPLPFLPRLNDFGLAKVLESSMTETGSSVLLGTPLYMAPEQAWSRSDEIGPPTDVYALGAIFYELLTGRTPFQASSLAVMLDQIRSEFPIVPSKLKNNIPKALETICLKCLAKEPRDRYASARFLLDDLKTFANGGCILAKRPSLRRRLAQWSEQPARLRDSSLAIIFANIVIMGTMTLSILMARFQLIPSSTADGLVPTLMCVLTMCVMHIPLVYVGLIVATGRKWALIVSLFSGSLMVFCSASFMLGIMSTGKYYWNDIPGFRVVYGAVCIISVLQVLASIVGLCAINSARFKKSRAAASSGRSSVAISSTGAEMTVRRSRTRESSDRSLTTSATKVISVPIRSTFRMSFVFVSIGILALVGLTALLPEASTIHRIVQSFGDRKFGEAEMKPRGGTNFSAALDRVYVAENSFDGSSPFTLEAWIKPELPKGMIVNLNGMMSIHSDDGRAEVGPTVVIYIGENEMIYFHTKNPLTSGAWHHVAVVHHDETIRLFIDGLEATCDVFHDEGKEATTYLKTSPSIKLNSSLRGAGLVIGGNSPTASPKHRYPFHGQIRVVRLSTGIRYDSSFIPAGEFSVDDTTLAQYQFSTDEAARVDDFSRKSSPAIRRLFVSP